ncbi:MAG: alpha/beta hydrolase-fold protein [Planctomycetota bacterium]
MSRIPNALRRPFEFLVCVLALAGFASAQKKPAPLERKLAKELGELATDWWKARPPTRFVDWDAKTRAELEARARKLGPLPEGALASAVELLWTSAKKTAPKPRLDKGKLVLDTPYGEAWAYVVSATKQSPLLIGLHGGGEGAGSADEARGNWARKGAFGIYPQGIQLVHDTWNTVHGERFVLSLIEIAKLSFDVDPEHVVVAGMSMGGTGSWFFAGRHTDLFSGAAPFSGVLMAAPKSQLEFKEEVRAVQHGLVPNVRNLAMAYTIGLADKNTMPGTYLFVADRLSELAQADPGGYAKIRFQSIPGLDHAFPPGEPAKALDYLLAETRDTFPTRLVWEYVSAPSPEAGPADPVARIARPYFYWLGCKDPLDRQTITATRKGNAIELEARGCAHGTSGITLYLNAAMIDPAQDVVVTSAGKELYRGKPVPDAWTVLETLDARLDRVLVFDRRIEL